MAPAALVTPANSTSQIFAGTTYYGVDYSTKYGPQQVVPFLLGPPGIVAAIDRNASDPNIVVLSSGWGAGQTGTAIGAMQAANDPAMKNLKLVLLDNNTNRAGGGFWTTYWMFAPLLLTSAAPTPHDTTAPIVDTAYEYNINSDAPTYPINLFTDANSLVAYAYGYGAQATAPMPEEALVPVAPGATHYHYVVAPDGTVTEKTPVDGNITYVTFQSDGLPLVKPLRSVPVIGNMAANVVEPPLTVLVDAGYKDNSPIPSDPGVTQPVGLLPPPAQTLAAAQELPAATKQGVTSPFNENANSTSAVLATSPSGTIDMTGGNLVRPGSSAGPAKPAEPSNPVAQVFGGVTSALGGLATNLVNAAQKSVPAGPAASSEPGSSGTGTPSG
ncbi:MAG: hypothetical protein QOK02_4866 [Mycobacterium sp.]|nr:hypothetical protein [Mycobacterium sp.]